MADTRPAATDRRHQPVIRSRRPTRLDRLVGVGCCRRARNPVDDAEAVDDRVRSAFAWETLPDMDDLDNVDLHADVDRNFGPCGDPACPTGSPDLGAAAAALYAPPAAVSPPVKLSRRSARFGELAAIVEAALADNGVVIDPTGIDDNLRVRIRSVGDQLGVSDRTALGYAPDDVADSLASEILGAVWVLTARHARGEPATGSTTSRGHLRVVR